MKAISLWQPWASAIALGFKRIETRSWQTDYRGPLAIHAAKKLHRGALSELLAAGVPLPSSADEYPCGAIVAAVDLEMVCTTRDIRPFLIPSVERRIGPYERRLGDYGDGRYAWVLRNVRALERPVPLHGRQRLFDVPDDLVVSRPMSVWR